MRLRRPNPRRPTDTIVSLVDVVFFLLVFALLTGRMDATAAFSVAPPVSVTGAELPGHGATVSISRDGQWALDSVSLTHDEVLLRLVTRLGETPALLIRIHADARTPLHRVLRFIEDLRRTGAQNVVLIATPGA